MATGVINRLQSKTFLTVLTFSDSLKYNKPVVFMYIVYLLMTVLTVDNYWWWNYLRCMYVLWIKLFILNAIEWWVIYWTDECWNELNWQLDLLSITELNGILMDEIIQTYVGLD